MCRGASLGTCCAQGCDERIRCQDTHGYCDAHNPYEIDWDEDDELGEVRPAVVDAGPADSGYHKTPRSASRTTSGYWRTCGSELPTSNPRTSAEIERDIAGKRAELASWVLRENRDKANDELNALLDEWTQAKQ